MHGDVSKNLSGIPEAQRQPGLSLVAAGNGYPGAVSM